MWLKQRESAFASHLQVCVHCKPGDVSPKRLGSVLVLPLFLLFAILVRSQESGDLGAVVLCFCLQHMPSYRSYYSFMPCVYTE